MVENIVRKGEIACLQAISRLLTMFTTAMSLLCVKMRHCVVLGYCYQVLSIKYLFTHFPQSQLKVYY